MLTSRNVEPQKTSKTAWYIGGGRGTRSLPGMRGFPFKHLRAGPRREPAEGAPRKSLRAATESDSSAERGVRSRVSASSLP